MFYLDHLLTQLDPFLPGELLRASVLDIARTPVAPNDVSFTRLSFAALIVQLTARLLNEAQTANDSGMEADPSEGRAAVIKALCIRASLLHPCHLDVLASACAVQNACAECEDWQGALVSGRHVAAVCTSSRASPDSRCTSCCIHRATQ